VNDFRPYVLAVEKTFFAKNRSAALLNVFGDEIRAVGRRKGLRVVAFVPSTIKKRICGNGPRWTVENRQFVDGAKPAISLTAETA